MHIKGWSVWDPDSHTPILRDLNLVFGEGERILLLGPSGCGKSTLALCLNGLVPQSRPAGVSGHIEVRGFDTRTTPTREVARHVGIVFQDPDSQFCTMTVEDEIAFGLENRAVPRSEMEDRIAAALQRVGMADARKRRLTSLSGGEKQRVAIAAVLVGEPDFIILDEICSQLDPSGAREVLQALSALSQAFPRLTLLFIDHRIPLILHNVPISRAVVLDAEGRVRLDCSPSALLNRHRDTLRSLGIAPYPRWNAPPASSSGRTKPKRGKPLVQVESLRFSYPDKHEAIRDVSLSLWAGETLALVGANGSGKSTLARLMVGLERSQVGRVLHAGRPIRRWRAAALAETVGYVFQNPEHQFIAQTVGEELAMEGKLQGDPPALLDEKVREVLQRLGLASQASRNPFELSEGQKRRLSVFTMVFYPRPLLVLDEPTLGQDTRNLELLCDDLQALQANGMTLILISHDLNLVAQLADRVGVMERGRILAEGSPEVVFSDPAWMVRGRLLSSTEPAVSQREESR